VINANASLEEFGITFERGDRVEAIKRRTCAWKADQQIHSSAKRPFPFA
jgi:hypothetical protein